MSIDTSMEDNYNASWIEQDTSFNRAICYIPGIGDLVDTVLGYQINKQILDTTDKVKLIALAELKRDFAAIGVTRNVITSVIAGIVGLTGFSQACGAIIQFGYTYLQYQIRDLRERAVIQLKSDNFSYSKAHCIS